MNGIWMGDFYSTAGNGLTGWLNEKGTITPLGRSLPKAQWKEHQTKRFHFGVIADPILVGDEVIEWETRESISQGMWLKRHSGISTLRFFKQYAGQDVELYRIPGITKEDGIAMVRAISDIGDRGYGFTDFNDAGLDVFANVIGLQFPPYTPEQFTFSSNQEYICTEVPAFAASKIGRPIEPPGKKELWDIPVLYLQAIEEGRLIRYYKGNLLDLR